MRRVLKALLILIISLPVLAAIGYWYLQQQIAQAGISHLQLDVNRLTISSVSFTRVRFSLQQQETTQQIDLQNIDISWQWPQLFKPALQQVTIGPGVITLSHTEQKPTQTSSRALRLPSEWQLPDWLPRQLTLTDIDLQLPCPAGTCNLQLNGQLSYHAAQNSDQPAGDYPHWQSRLTIASNLAGLIEAAPVILDAQYQATPQPALRLTLQQDQQFGLSFKQLLNPGQNLAETELVLAISPPSPANQAVLQQWGMTLPEAWLNQFQQPVQLYSKFNWQLPADGDLSKLLSSHDVDAMLIARAPDPFYLPQLGLIQGELTAELNLTNQVVQRWQLNGTGTLSELPLPAAVSEYGIRLNPLQFQLNAEALEELNLAALPLQLSVKSNGDSNFALAGELSVNLTASPRVDMQQATLTAGVAALTLPNNSAQLHKLQLSAGLSGYWQADNWQLLLSDNTRLSGAIDADPFNIAEFTLSLNDSRFNATQPGIITLNSTVNASINQLSHPALFSQNWQWQGALSGDLTNIMLTDAKLSNDAGLMAAHSLQYQPGSGDMALNWQLAELFLLAGNPLATTLTDWPELLTLNRGKLTASGDVSINNGGLTSQNQLMLGDVGGIYDRSLFAGLNATLALAVSDNSLQFSTTNLNLNRLNHGFEMGPLTLAASASLPLDSPQHIKVNLQQAELQVMQGSVSASAQQLDFFEPENQLTLQLQQIDLASLLKQHPSSDLTGNGKLSGAVPITISARGVSVNDGKVAAEAPGGRLQYKSDSTSAMAKTNANMKLVFDALEDFQYSVLSSNISYDTSGKLLLGLTIQGSNPKLQQGRAINLNINLEEDLPALITSLQLTNKLNDVITQRVQQYLKQQQAATAANGEKP